MKNNHFILLVLFISSSMFSQSTSEFVGVFTSEKQIFFRWTKKNDNQSYNIYRKTSEAGNYIKINNKPIELMSSRIEILNWLGNDYSDYKEAFHLDYPEQIVTIYQSQPDFIKFAAAFTPKLAVLLGDG